MRKLNDHRIWGPLSGASTPLYGCGCTTCMEEGVKQEAMDKAKAENPVMWLAGYTQPVTVRKSAEYDDVFELVINNRVHQFSQEQMTRLANRVDELLRDASGLYGDDGW
jgi:hypothetical protein